MQFRSSILLLFLLAAVPLPRQLKAQTSLPGSPADAALTLAAEPAGATEMLATLFGRSGALRTAVLSPSARLDEMPIRAALAGADAFRWQPVYDTKLPLLGDPVFSERIQPPPAPGVWRLEPRDTAASLLPLTFVTQVPFAAKRGGVLNGYRIGTYRTEQSNPGDRYAPPSGFVEVTPANQDLFVSEHFQLRHFLTKDQREVWPKYLVLDLRLIDKLELVLAELNRMGVRADRMHVMSGYRTPQYNGPGGNGRAALSRHTYGDAADVWVDNDSDGLMDDLNGDGKIDTRDALIMLEAVERIELRYPELTGGAGVYAANSAHGPFIHIDARGDRARW